MVSKIITLVLRLLLVFVQSEHLSPSCAIALQVLLFVFPWACSTWRKVRGKKRSALPSHHYWSIKPRTHRRALPMPYPRGRIYTLPSPAKSRPKKQVVLNLVHGGAQCTMTSPTTEKIRLTITVTPEVHETFLRMSKATGFSLGRTMGEWLGDTQEAALAMTEIVEKAKEAPKQAMRQMHSYVLGLTDMTGDLLQRLGEKEREQSESPLARDAAAEAGSAPPPRPVIRGGKSKDKNHASGGKAL